MEAPVHHSGKTPNSHSAQQTKQKNGRPFYVRALNYLEIPGHWYRCLWPSKKGWKQIKMFTAKTGRHYKHLLTMTLSHIRSEKHLSLYSMQFRQLSRQTVTSGTSTTNKLKSLAEARWTHMFTQHMHPYTSSTTANFPTTIQRKH